MKFFHISDLHIGKQLHGYSLIEDQRFILNQILERIDEEKPQALLIAGDIYDKSIPSTDAVELLDGFLTSLSRIQDLEVFLISGNHDSDRRLDFASRILSRQGIHVAGMAPNISQPEIVRREVEDEYGKVNIYLVPFVKPSYVREIYPDREIHSYEEAFGCLLEDGRIRKEDRNLLVAHQFFVNGGEQPAESESETYRIGGQDSMDIRILGDLFEYVALGHLHAPQKIGREIYRYCGSPLKYSISEEHQKKGITVVEIQEKGKTDISQIPLKPLRDVRSIKGKLEEVLALGNKGGRAVCEDYISITLTDEEELYEPKAALQNVYPNLLEWSVDNTRTRHEIERLTEEVRIQSPMESFGEFYEQMQGVPLSEGEERLMMRMIERAGGESR